MKKAILFTLLLTFICSALAMSEESKLESGHHNDNINEKRNNFPKKYQGDSLSVVIKKFKLIDKARKDEFTKSSKSKEDALAISTRSYRFVISPELNHCGMDSDYSAIPGVKYDADNEMLSINLCVEQREFGYNQYHSGSDNRTAIKISENVQRTSSIGQNSFGATATITTTIVEEQGIALANVKETSKLVTFSLPLKPRDAKIIKKDLAFYIEIALIASDSNHNIMKTISGHEATIDAPSAFYISGEYLKANIIEAGVFRKSNGHVLSRERFELN